MENITLTSKELLEKIGIAEDTLKHWRYGYYMTADKYRVYYREDMAGVPCKMVSGKSFDFYEYDIDTITDWVRSWKTKSQKKNSVLKRLMIVREGGTIPPKKRRRKTKKTTTKESHG